MDTILSAFDKWPESEQMFWNKFFSDGIAVGWSDFISTDIPTPEWGEYSGPQVVAWEKYALL